MKQDWVARVLCEWELARCVVKWGGEPCSLNHQWITVVENVLQVQVVSGAPRQHEPRQWGAS